MKRRNGSSQIVRDDDPQFARFWDVYPKRVAKKDARKAWLEINPVPELVDRIVTAIAWQTLLPAWRHDGGAFVPYPASWLRGARWEDEPPVNGHQPSYSDWDGNCPHIEEHVSRWRCDQATQLGRPRKPECVT